MADLEPDKKIEAQSWMTSGGAGSVIAALNEGGKRPQALFVGGCVRNMLLGEKVEDVDIATIWTPQEVTQKLESRGIKMVPTGIDHGTVRGVGNGRGFEITTLRRVVEPDG